MYSDEIILNLVLILVLGVLAAIFAPDDFDFFGHAGRVFVFVWVVWVTFMLSLIGWGIFIAAHFIGKYW